MVSILTTAQQPHSARCQKLKTAAQQLLPGKLVCCLKPAAQQLLPGKLAPMMFAAGTTTATASNEDLLLSEIAVIILLVSWAPPVVMLVVPHHGYGLLHKRRPHHGAIKDHILLSVDGTHKQSLCLLCAVLMHIAAQVGLMLEGAHFRKLLVQDIHALHGISLYYNSILAHLQVQTHC